MEQYIIQRYVNGKWLDKQTNDLMTCIGALQIMRKLFGNEYRIVDMNGDVLSERRLEERK